MRILFFDTAKATGWAFTDGTEVRFGHHELRPAKRHGAVLLAFTRFVVETIELWKPDVVGAEKPRLTKRDNEHRLRRLYGYVNEVDKAAYRRDIEYHEPTVEQIRRHFLGTGYPKKSEQAKIAVCNQCRTLGWNVATDDEGDALAGLDYLRGIKKPAYALKVTPMFADPKPLPR